jgi:hypothetical protein
MVDGREEFWAATNGQRDGIPGVISYRVLRDGSVSARMLDGSEHRFANWKEFWTATQDQRERARKARKLLMGGTTARSTSRGGSSDSFLFLAFLVSLSEGGFGKLFLSALVLVGLYYFGPALVAVVSDVHAHWQEYLTQTRDLLVGVGIVIGIVILFTAIVYAAFS